LNITGMVHVNINCSNFAVSQAFYEMLGFEVFWAVPATNTPEVAAAVGMPPYRVKGALLRLKNSAAVVIDLLEWQDPTDNSPPYQHLYHLGLARLALQTSDMDADYAFLQQQGVHIVSPPATVSLDGGKHGSRFFCFQDPDGTYLELVQSF
jgi:catechol 2,3-dioxygenase-like lactoylglutathione lyase family enzyme